MENPELKYQNSREAEQKLKEDFDRLQKIAEIMKDLGLEVIDRAITIESLKDAIAGMGFPIVRDGLDGIRVSYLKDRGLVVWFTNGFENPENPKRKEIVRRLKDAGLM